jgi:hypothetical protein
MPLFTTGLQPTEIEFPDLRSAANGKFGKLPPLEQIIRQLGAEGTAPCCMVAAAFQFGAKLVFRHELIRIAIKPALARLGGSDHRVPGRASMFAGVLVWRTIAAQGHATVLARSQMHPAAADLHALAAFKPGRMFHIGNCGQMCTRFVSHELHRFQIFVNKLDCHRAFANSRSYPFH